MYSEPSYKSLQPPVSDPSPLLQIVKDNSEARKLLRIFLILIIAKSKQKIDLPGKWDLAPENKRTHKDLSQ
jgi:hypothetical protein